MGHHFESKFWLDCSLHTSEAISTTSKTMLRLNHDKLISLLIIICLSWNFTFGKDSRPNVLVVVVDDASLTDFAPYGGEARMPVIQRLADNGACFKSYRTSPLCSPSRAMLLTGVDRFNLPFPPSPRRPFTHHQLLNLLVCVFGFIFYCFSML